MHHFTYRDGVLNAEELPLDRIAEEYGTPTYVYSKATLERHVNALDSAFDEIEHLTCFSVKANSSGAILKLFGEMGIGADIVSGGELFRCLRAGIPAEKIVYSGVGKSADEIRYALDSGILCFNVESHSELLVIDRIAGEIGVQAPVAFRINPNVDPKTHPYISTGLSKNKFGIPHEEALDLYREAMSSANIDVMGIDMHIGSQLTDVKPYREAAERLRDLIVSIRNIGVNLRHVDIGGGLGIRYDAEEPPAPSAWAEMVIPVFKDLGIRLVVEPGRSIVGNAGVLLTRALYVKHNGPKTFVVVDAGMNDLSRPTLYGSHHDILPVDETSAGTVEVDVVGPICESGDFLAKDRAMPLPKEGDLLAVMSAGAYGMTMASNYNSRPRGAEVMVSGDTAKLITTRETFEDLVGREI